ncbi:hypothetical protein K7A41_00485 [Sphingobacterium sp. InxBP1]|uniref:hypothetical protein n=1 Tax=Sphingobacterium sp. InxBP1 TaxID=2870328 RepID=UPI0022442ADA|nr:hypothetical protein [Sphingobacterium sp. InxBP1]MCW8309697.1 hypothetical protein [Sphingobacterium sp. InxBP1]
MKINGIILLVALCLAGILPSGAQSTHLTIADTRNVATVPDDYSQKLKSEFKFGTTLNTPSGTYVYTLGLRGWRDDTGGPAHELAFAPDHLYLRSGTAAGGWEAWREILLTDSWGNVGIGTNNPKAKLAVDGNILAKEIKVKTDITVPDYVFEPDYELPSLKSIEDYVKFHKHLPDIPSASKIANEGLDLAEMNLLLLKKIEELTLHVISQQKQIDKLSDKMQIKSMK